MPINKDLFDQEYARAVEKYSPEMWAGFDPSEMIAPLLREVDELKTALWRGEFSGPHGIERESYHVIIVALRIAEEMKRRELLKEG